MTFSLKHPPRKLPLRRSNIERMPNEPGIYGFWCRGTGRWIYVGMARDQTVRERVMQHWGNSSNKKLNAWIRFFGDSLEICYLKIPHDKIRQLGHQLDHLETRLIRMWNPETNIKKKRR